MRQHGGCNPSTDTAQNLTHSLRRQCEEQIMVYKSLGMQPLVHKIVSPEQTDECQSNPLGVSRAIDQK